jgi:hypothetical protein
MEEAKRRYDEIQVPEELHERLEKLIADSAPDRVKEAAADGKRGNVVWMKGCAWVAAVALFTLALNTNTAFAQEMGEIPVLGAVARVLTFRSYVKEDADMGIAVEIPAIETIEEDTGLAEEVNQEILERCEAYAQAAIQRAEEYKKAFLETGGTQEEWEAHNIQIRVWYEIKSQTEDYLSFTVSGTENWTSAYSETYYYNLDLKEGKRISLQDVLGEDYIAIADASIREQMAQMEKEEGITFFSQEEGGFSGITEETNFYMNEKGNPVIVFDKYEIAPGSAGEIEFEIPQMG